jgi:hypothetical protein
MKMKSLSEALVRLYIPLGKLLCCYMALALGHGAHISVDARFQTIG